MQWKEIIITEEDDINLRFIHDFFFSLWTFLACHNPTLTQQDLDA